MLVTYASTLTAGFIPAFVGLFSFGWSMNETPAGGVSSAGEAGDKVRQGTIAGSGHASKMLLSIILQYLAKKFTLKHRSTFHTCVINSLTRIEFKLRDKGFGGET